MVEFIMEYKCERCDTAWTMQHENCCDDRCPSCDMSNEPVSVEELS